MTIVLCGTLEYLTSYFMEKIFKARWWDYSKRKFNLNGRVCLGTLVPFGIFGMLLMYVTNPFFLGKIQQLPQMWLDILFWAFLVIYIIDNIVSGVVIGYIKKTEKRFTPEVDNTEEMTEKVKAVLETKSPLHRRLVKAYPKLQAVKVKIKEKKEQIKEQIVEQKKEIEDKVENTTKKVGQKVREFNNNPDKKLFLISLKAGGTGLNLIGADMVIHYDPWWNLSAENQATDRTYRIGQKKNVQVYKLITKNSIEEKIYELQKRKETLIDSMLSVNQTFISKLSKEDIMNLFE